MLLADARTAIPLTLFATDASGLRVANCNAIVRIEVAGPARLIGTGNGDPTSHEPNLGNARSLFNGLAQAILQTTDEPGEIVVRVSSDGLRDASITLQSVAGPNDRAPVVRRKLFVEGWRMSPLSPTPPDLSIAPSDQDMNTWDRITPGMAGLGEGREGFVVLRATCELPKAWRSTGARLVARMAGVIAARVGEIDVAVTPESIALPPGEGKRAIALLVDLRTENAGLRSMPEIVE